MSIKDKLTSLDDYYRQIKTVILDRQHPVTGLLPASTAVTIHGDYRDAWVRDNVYSIIAVWGLALAYRNSGSRPARAYELESATIKLMRGLLRSMMRQSHKVEQFKSSLALHDALHAKYDTQTGNTVVGDHEWGHLQIDATSIYLVMLGQMIGSGLPIISTMDEVNFIQNLVYYIERAYRIPDYGIWERGEKTNVGYVELNASSMGMARSALRAMSGFNLFGNKGEESTVVHVMQDNIAYAEITLESMLPRESSTKEVDSALLSIIGFPAFAVHDPDLVSLVKSVIRRKLAGRFGYKRFLLDGHQTVMEDPDRHYYNPEELKQFEDIESEWPLFYCYEFLNALFEKDEKEALKFQKKVQEVMVEKAGMSLIPELYYVPEVSIEKEKRNPHSQERLPNSNIPLVWAQSLYLLGSLMKDGHLTIHDIDPLKLSKKISHRHPTIQILLLTKSPLIKRLLEKENIPVQSPEDLGDTIVCFPDTISQVYTHVGANKKLGLTGRSPRRLKTLVTSRLFNINGQQVICISLFFLPKEFYLAFDVDFLINRFKGELSYIHRHWNQPGQPLVTVLLTESMWHSGNLGLTFLKELQTGSVVGLPVKLGSFDELAPYTTMTPVNNPEIHLEPEPLELHTEKTFFLKIRGEQVPLSNEQELEIELVANPKLLEEMLLTSVNIYEQIEILEQIIKTSGLDHSISINGEETLVSTLTEQIYFEAGRLHHWSVVRLASALLGKVDINLQHSINILLARQKIIQVGKAFSDDSLIIRPIPFSDLMSKINTFCRDDLRDRVFTQEILIYVGLLNKINPDIFKDMITIRVSYITLLLTSDVARELDILQDDAIDALMDMAPSSIQARLEKVLTQYQSARNVVRDMESLKVKQIGRGLSWVNDLNQPVDTPEEGWLSWRKSTGTLSRLDRNLIKGIWHLFEHCKGLIIGGKLEKRNRLDSNLILSDMTPGEKAFAFRIEHLLNKIPAPEYRQLTLEAMTVAARFSEQNPSLYVDDYLVFDVINGHAVRLAFLDAHPEWEDSYQDRKADAWTEFYSLPPRRTTHFIMESFKYLLNYQPQQLEESTT